MKYLITGYKGFIGRNLTSYLSSLSLPYSILDINNLFHHNADVLVHLSALTDVRMSAKHLSLTISKNITQTANLLEFARDYGFKKFIFASSASADKPRSPYLASKLACEALCECFRSNLEVCILRFSNVYGPMSEYKSSVIPNMIKSLIKNEAFYIYGDGTQTRNFVYIDDVVRSITNAKCPLQTVASNRSISINELVKIANPLALKYFGKRLKIFYIDPIAEEIHKVNTYSDFTSFISLEKGLEKTFKWYAEKAVNSYC